MGAGAFILSEQTFFSSDVGCLFRWRWTVEVASSTLSVEAAFTMSPGRGDLRDIHNVYVTVGGSCLQSSSTLSVEAVEAVEAAFTVSPGRGDIRDIRDIQCMSQYVLYVCMSCIVSSVHTRHESRTPVGAETCAYSPSNLFICFSSDVVM